MHNYFMRMQNWFLICFNCWFFHKSGHKSFDRSGPFCISGHNLIWSVMTMPLLNTKHSNFTNGEPPLPPE